MLLLLVIVGVRGSCLQGASTFTKGFSALCSPHFHLPTFSSAIYWRFSAVDTIVSIFGLLYMGTVYFPNPDKINLNWCPLLSGLSGLDQTLNQESHNRLPT